MSTRGVLVLIVLAAAAAIVLWLLPSRPSGHSVDGATPAPILPFAPEDVVAVHVYGREIEWRVRRTAGEDGWAFDPPSPFEVDDGAIARWLLGFAQTRPERSIAASANRDDRYGLASRSAVGVRFTARDGRTASWTFGTELPTEPGRYARADGGPLVTIEASVRSRLLDGRETILRRRVTRQFAETDVVELLVERRDGRSTRLVRESDGWVMASPIRDAASDSAIAAALRVLGALRVDRPEATVPDPGSVFARVAVRFADGPRETVVIAAGDGPDSNRAARLGAGWSGLVPEVSVSSILRTDWEFREHGIVPISPASVTRVVVESDGNRWELDRGVDAEPIEGGAARLDDWIRRLCTVVAIEPLDVPHEREAPGFVSVRLIPRTGEPVELHIGAERPGGTRVVRSSARPGLTFLVDGESLTGVSVGPWVAEGAGSR